MNTSLHSLVLIKCLLCVVYYLGFLLAKQHLFYVIFSYFLLMALHVIVNHLHSAE